MDNKLFEQLNNWCEKYKYSEVMRTIEALPKSEWNYTVKGFLGQAYINQSKYDKALEILLSEHVHGAKDPLWNTGLV